MSSLEDLKGTASSISSRLDSQSSAINDLKSRIANTDQQPAIDALSSTLNDISGKLDSNTSALADLAQPVLQSTDVPSGPA